MNRYGYYIYYGEGPYLPNWLEAMLTFRVSFSCEYAVIFGDVAEKPFSVPTGRFTHNLNRLIRICLERTFWRRRKTQRHKRRAR